MTIINGYEITGRMPLFKPALRELTRQGIKTETRRVMKSQPPQGFEFFETDTATRFRWRGYSAEYGCEAMWTATCPYGKPDDIRVLREPLFKNSGLAFYTENIAPVIINDNRVTWHWEVKNLSAMFMPTAAGRTLVRYTDIHAERLQDISWKGALAEGIFHYPRTKNHVDLFGLAPIEELKFGWDAPGCCHSPTGSFSFLWDKINAERGYPWSSNLWVWVVKWELLT